MRSSTIAVSVLFSQQRNGPLLFSPPSRFSPTFLRFVGGAAAVRLLVFFSVRLCPCARVCVLRFVQFQSWNRSAGEAPFF